MPKLPDGSEKGLKGNFDEDFSVCTRTGLAPRAGHIERDAPYKRIATEEAWTFPALVKAQVEYLESGEAPDDDSLKMAGMFAKMPSLQEMLQDLGGSAPVSIWTSSGIDRQLLLLTAPGVQVVRPVRGHSARARGERHRRRCLPTPSLTAFRRCAAFDPARRGGIGEGIGARGDRAGAQRRGAQFAFSGPLSRRTRVLANPRGARGATISHSTSTPPRPTTHPHYESARLFRRARRLSRTTCGCTRWG